MDLLSQENWDSVFMNDNINIIYNNFLNSYLRIFYACFPIKKQLISVKPKPWITSGIRISCANKKSSMKPIDQVWIKTVNYIIKIL